MAENFKIAEDESEFSRMSDGDKLGHLIKKYNLEGMDPNELSSLREYMETRMGQSEELKKQEKLQKVMEGNYNKMSAAKKAQFDKIRAGVHQNLEKAQGKKQEGNDKAKMLKEAERRKTALKEKMEKFDREEAARREFLSRHRLEKNDVEDSEEQVEAVDGKIEL